MYIIHLTNSIFICYCSVILMKHRLALLSDSIENLQGQIPNGEKAKLRVKVSLGIWGKDADSGDIASKLKIGSFHCQMLNS